MNPKTGKAGTLVAPVDPQKAEEADKADRAYYQSLTPQERIDILLQLVARHAVNEDGTPKRFERVYRVAKLGER